MAHALPSRPGPRPARGLITAALVAAAGLALALAQTSPGHALLRKAGLYEEPASYTSLAFTDPQSLPAQLSPVPSRVSVSFGISNSSADPHGYHWSVLLHRAGQVKHLAAGEAEVPAGESTTVAPVVTAACSAGQAQVSVQLAAPAESISFWLACSPRTEPAGQAGVGGPGAAEASFAGCVPGKGGEQ
jgi:hypothetical protein